MGNKPECTPELEPVDDDSSSGLHELLDLLDADSAGRSLLDEQDLLELIDCTGESTDSHEYILDSSALHETKSLEELAEMATGSYKLAAPERDSADTSDSYFQFTRNLEALRQDQIDSEDDNPPLAVR